MFFCLALPVGAQTETQSWSWQGKWPIRHLTVASQGLALAGSDRSTYLYALDATDGHVAWTRNVKGSVWSPPTLSGSSAYLAPNDTALWNLRVETGEVIWWLGPRFPATESFPGSVGRPALNRAPAALYDKGLVSVSLNGILSRLTPEGVIGAQARLLASAERDQFWSRPAVLGTHVWLGSTGGRLWRVELENPTEYTIESLGGTRAFPSRDQVLADVISLEDRVLVATLSGSLHCYAPTGEKLWLRRLGVGRVPLTAGGRVIFAPVRGPQQSFFVATKSRVYCLNKFGQTLWTRPFVQGIAAPPVYSELLGVVVTDADGTLTRLDPGTGEPRETLSTPAAATAGPALWGSVAILGYADGWVRAYRFTPESSPKSNASVWIPR